MSATTCMRPPPSDLTPPRSQLGGEIITGPSAPLTGLLTALAAFVPSVVVPDDVGATARPPRRLELEPTAWCILRAALTGQVST